MMALANCKKCGEKGNPNRNEKRVYYYKGYWYLTSEIEQ